MHGSSLNGDNKLEQGITIRRKALKDSFYLNGKQKDGKYWREDILNDIVIGYVNVPADEKAKFDKAISTLSVEKNFESTLQHELIHSKQE